MISDSNEVKIIEQLEAINAEFGILSANMVILKDYFAKLIDSYKERKYMD